MSDDAEMRQELEALKKEVQILKDKEEIRELLAHYGNAMDLGYKDLWYDMWTEDGTFSVNEFDQIYYMRGKDAIKARFGPPGRATGPGSSTQQHLQLASAIKVDGDKAFVTNYQVITKHQDTEYPILARTTTRNWTLERVNGKWLIKESIMRGMKDVENCRKVIPPEW